MVNAKNIKIFFIKHTPIIIFFLALFFYITCGLYVSFNNTLVTNTRCDFLYGFDVGLKYLEYFIQPYKTYAIAAHPILSLIYSPFIMLIQGLTSSSLFSFIFIQSLIASFSCMVFYLCLKKVGGNNTLIILLSLIFLFSFSNIMLSALPEGHIINGLFQVLFIYYIIEIIYVQKSTKLTSVQILLLSLFFAVTAAINIINILFSLIIILYVLFSIYKSNIKKICFDFFKIILLFSIVFGTGIIYQKMIFHDKYTFIHHFTESMNPKHEKNFYRFMNKYSDKKKFKYSFKGTLIEPLYALKSEASKDEYLIGSQVGESRTIPERKLKFWNFREHQSNIRYIPFILLSFLPLIVGLIRRKKKELKYKGLILISGLVIFSNFLCNYFWEVNNSFLFSQNVILYLMLIISLLYIQIPQIIAFILCFIFLIYQVFTNLHAIMEIEHFTRLATDAHHGIITYISWAFVATVITGIIIYTLKKLLKKEILNLPLEKKYVLYITIYTGYIVIWGMFLGIFRGMS